MRCRLAYLSGPIDAARTYQDYRREAQPDYYGTLYLAQLFKLLDELNADGLIITTLPHARTRSTVDHLTFANIPPVSGSRGLLYHLGMLVWSARCIGEIIRYRANVALLTAGQDYFWAFRILSLFGIRLMASLHCTLWPNLAPRRAHKKLLIWLNGNFFYPACDHIQSVSDTIVAQIVGSSAALKVKPRKFVPTYDPSRFAAAVPANWPPAGEAFRILYVGRLEVNKGALDLVEITRRLNADGPRRYELDACGEGSARERMESATAKAGLEQAIRICGQCATPLLARKFDQCHAVIVPTRSDFEEGYAKVAAEAVLNLRPVVLSAACPALADVAAAAMEVRVDDVDDYVRAIRELALDPALYAAKVEATDPCRQRYLDDRNSYGAVLKAGLARVLNDSRPSLHNPGMSAGRKPSLPRHEIPGQLLRFGLSSAFSATVSLGLPLVLHEWLRLDPTLSVGISQTTVLLANFLMIRMFVFRSQSGARGDFLRYAGSAVAFRGLEFLTFLLLFRFAGLFYFTALVVTLAASTAIKFFWYRFLFGGRVSSAL